MMIFKLLLKSGLLGHTPSLVLISPSMETSQPLWATICCNKLLGIDDKKIVIFSSRCLLVEITEIKEKCEEKNVFSVLKKTSQCNLLGKSQVFWVLEKAVL